jgi:hypothetical protein
MTNESPNLEFDVEKTYFGALEGSGDENEQFTKSALDFLNSGGILQSIRPDFNKSMGSK